MVVKIKKKPLQQRSQALFNSIVESAARVLPVQGYARATTNKIAHYAGVSIGSLYQYFPHKDSIFANLLERELTKQFDEVSTLVGNQSDKPLDDIIDFLTDRFFTIYVVQKRELSRELFLNAPRIGQVGEILYVRNKLVNCLAELLAKKNHMDLNLAKQKIFIALNAFMGVIQTCTLVKELPAPLESLKKQTADLLKFYLKPQ